eukprot:3160321-Pyramimonas_sp.AAC.1
MWGRLRPMLTSPASRAIGRSGPWDCSLSRGPGHVSVDQGACESRLPVAQGACDVPPCRPAPF